MYIRGIGKVAACAASGVIYTFTLAVSNIILLLYFKQGISGYLISAVLAYLLPSLYLLIIATDKCFKYSFIDINLIKQILKLSIPLMPTAILWVLMNLSDKYAILWFVGTSGNGIYAVAHKIPTIISVVYGIFQQAWQLTTFELENKEERSRTYTNVFELLTGIIFILGAVLIILNRVYITYGCNENYLEAWKISPILMYSSILNCVSGLLGSNYLIMHDTKSALKVTAVGAFINTILNFILVPIYGVYGAALATIVGYLYMVVKKYFDTSIFTPLRIKIKRFIFTNIIFVCMFFSAFLESQLLFYSVNSLLVILIVILYNEQLKKMVYTIKNML